MRGARRTVGVVVAALVPAAVLLACQDKRVRVPFVIPVTPTQVVSGPTVVFYTVAARRGTPVIVSFNVSLDGGATYKTATPAAGTPPAALIPANPAGAPAFFYWDSFKDLGPGFHRNVVLAPTGGGVQATTLPFIADETDSFVPPAGAQGVARSSVLAVPLPDDSVYVAGGTMLGLPIQQGEIYDPYLDTFATVPAGGLTTPRTGFAGALLSSGRVLTAGGVDGQGNALGTAEYFSKTIGITRPVPGGLVVPRQDGALAPIPGGGAVVAGGLAQGGKATGTVEVYDPTIGQDGGFASVLTSPLTAVRLPTATALADGRVLFAGGADASGNAVTSAFLYDPVARTVTATAAPLGVARVGHRATRLSNGKVLLSGGETVFGSSGSAVPSCEVFDPATGAFSFTGTMNHPRAFHGQDLSGGRVLATGGQGQGDITAGSAESFNQDLGVWFPTQFPLVSPRPDAAVVAVGSGRALVLGGEAAPEVHFPFNQTAPETWTMLLSPTQSRAGHTATMFQSSGDILLVGGTTQVTSATASVEMFRPYGAPPLPPDRFEPKAPLHFARAFHCSALLPDGRIAVFGGRDANGNALGSIEIYEFFSGSWTVSAATLAVPRSNAQAVLLGDGDVLIVGGRDGSGNVVGQAELYHFPTDTVTTTGTLAVPRADHEVNWTGAFALVVGGTDSKGFPVSPVEAFDQGSGTFRSAGSLQVGRAGVALSQVPFTPDLVVTGGNDASGTRSDLEAIDIFSGFPSPLVGFAPLETPRAFHRANQLQDTSVLLTGGKNGNLVLDASGLYFVTSPAPFGFTALNSTVRPTIVPRMMTSRTLHTASVLQDGRVLVVGGLDQRGVAVAGGEVFVAPADLVVLLNNPNFQTPGPGGQLR